MLRKIDANIWVAEQPLRYFGLGVGTRMTAIRLATGELAVISPIEPRDAIAAQLNELGTVRHIIAPNLYHYLFTADFKKVYPNAILWAVPGLEIKKPDLPIDRTIEQNANVLGGSPWSGLEHRFFEGLRTLTEKGFQPFNECVFFHAESRTLVLTDVAYHFDEAFPGLMQFATRILGGYKKLSPSFLEQIATTNKEKVKASVEKILGWDFDRVVMAHGSIVENGGKQRFREGYERFLGRSFALSGLDRSK